MLNKQPNIGRNVILNGVILGDYVEIKDHSVFEEVSFGDYSYTAGYNQISYAAIGKFASIATFVRINPGNHPTYHRVAQHHFTYRSGLFGMDEDDHEFFQWRRENKVEIGHDVWIGHNATIMPGVKIGNGAVIGAGSIVTKDVESYCVVVGVPSKVVKMRFSDELIQKIENSKWWDWDYDTLKERLSDFRNIKEFENKWL
jgi:phosphonate metabolism protein (transferase hexapeptide repeat family)